MGDNLNRKRAGEDASVEGGENAPSASIKAVYPGRASATKKHENNIPLFNAMRTTIAHSVLSFAQQTADEGTQEMSQESSISSGTPLPAREDTPAKVGAQTLVAQDSTTRSTLAVGKKRKKRWSHLYIIRGMTTNSAEQLLIFRSFKRTYTWAMITVQ